MDNKQVLSDKYMEWFDKLVKQLMNPHIGNLGAPNEEMMNVLNTYLDQRKNFLSDNTYNI